MARLQPERPQKASTSVDPRLEVSRQAARLDQVIHERVRLGIVTALAGAGTLSFTQLKHILQTSDGNLSVHARRLEEAGYLDCTKRFEGRTPRTEYSLTARGQQALDRYLTHLQALIEATQSKP